MITPPWWGFLFNRVYLFKVNQFKKRRRYGYSNYRTN